MRLFHILRSLWIWTASASLILLWTPLLFVIWLFERDPRRLRTARWFRRLGRNLARVNPWHILISGQENLEPGRVYVIVSNHQSLADIPVVAQLKLDAKWVGKAELFRLPLVGWMMRMSRDIPVERSDRTKRAHTLAQCALYLRQRCSVVFFPEGTRSRDGQVLPFAEGPFKLAIREQVSLLPLVVEGSGNALPKHSWVFGGRQDIHLHILPAVPVTGWDAAHSGALRDHVRRKIIDELSRMREGEREESLALQ